MINLETYKETISCCKWSEALALVAGWKQSRYSS